MCSPLFIASAQAQNKLTVVPFVSTNPRQKQSDFYDVSRKLQDQLKVRGITVVPYAAKGAVAAKPPNEGIYKQAKALFAKGRDLLRSKKYEAAQKALKSGLAKFEQAMAHMQDTDELHEFYRLLGIAYFRLGMNEQGEEAIQQLGYIAPKKRYSRTRMFRMLQRILKRAQKRGPKGGGKLYLTLPRGVSVSLNFKPVLVKGRRLRIRNLKPGKHYLKVTQSGHFPWVQAITVKPRRWTRLRIKMTRQPTSSGPNFSAEVRVIQSLLQRKALNNTVKKLCGKLASGLSVPYVLLGYHDKVGVEYKLHMFLYRHAGQKAGIVTPVVLDLELMQADIKFLTVSKALKGHLGAFNKLQIRPWREVSLTASTPAARPTPAAARPTPVATARPTPRPAATNSGPDPDDYDPDEDSRKAAPRPTPRPAVVARPTPRPVVRQVTPRPTPRPATPRSDGDPDDPDDPPARPTPRPAVVARPTPRPVVRQVTPRPTPRPATPRSDGDPDDPDDPAPARPTPRPVVRSVTPPPVRRSNRPPRRVAYARKRPGMPGFDADKDMDWSNPVPRSSQNYRGSEPDYSTYRVPNPNPLNVRPAPPPVRRKTEPQPDVRRPTPPPVRRDPDVITRPDPPPRRNPPKAGAPVTKQWWFWTLVATGTAAVATTATILVIYSLPATSYNVSVQINPPQ